MTTDAELQSIRTRYDAAITAAKAQRATAIQAAYAAGRTQADIARATGYTRETLRRITRPDVADAVCAAKRTARHATAAEETIA